MQVAAIGEMAIAASADVVHGTRMTSWSFGRNAVFDVVCSRLYDAIGRHDDRGRSDSGRSDSGPGLGVASKVVRVTKGPLQLVINLVHGLNSTSNVGHHIVLVLLESPDVLVPEAAFLLSSSKVQA